MSAGSARSARRRCRIGRKTGRLEGRKVKTMPRPSKLRRVLKWSGLVLCALTLLGYPLSYGREFAAIYPSKRFLTGSSVFSGNFLVSIPKELPAAQHVLFKSYHRGPGLSGWFRFECYVDERGTRFMFPIWSITLAL